MNLIFIGSDFYMKSHTMMSSIYEVDINGNVVGRSDWGFVQSELSKGQEVHIVPANERQMKWAYEKLGRILEK